MANVGLKCPKCGSLIGAGSVRDTDPKDGRIDRYRVCPCGRSLPTSEYPKAFVQNLIRMANATGQGGK